MDPFEKGIKKEIPTDPTQSSRMLFLGEQLHFTGEVNDSGNKIMQTERGERFHEITSYPEMQQFVSRILKPFLNVSDVVRDADGKWYSYEPDITRIRHATDPYQIPAELDVLRYVMQDTDHNAGRNVNQSYNDSRHLLFDFEATRDFFLERASLHDFQKRLRHASHGRKIYCHDLLRRMYEYYTSIEGRNSIEAAFKASGKTMNELFDTEYLENKNLSLEDFYNLFIFRLARMKEIAAEAVAADTKHT